MKNPRAVVASALVAAFGLGIVGFGQGQGNRFEGVELSIEPVAGNVHMIQRPGGGGNVGVFVGPDGVLLHCLRRCQTNLSTRFDR